MDLGSLKVNVQCENSSDWSTLYGGSTVHAYMDNITSWLAVPWDTTTLFGHLTAHTTIHHYMIFALRYQTALNVGSTTHTYTCNVLSIYYLLCHKMLKYI